MEEASFIKLTLKSQMYFDHIFILFFTVVPEIIMNYACNIHTYEDDQALAFELFFILDMKRVMVTTTMR